MRKLEIGEIKEAVRGRLVSGPPERYVQGVSTDTRTLEKDNLFVALRGDNFDGHTFVDRAVQAGAAGVVVEERGLPEKLPEGVGVVLVKDTLAALGDLARYYRGLFGVTVVGVTGSNGKTTTKSMIAHLLAAAGTVLASPKSFNNFVGVPLTLFGLEEGTDFAVVEMGANHPGEIARLAAVCDPNIGVITNIGPVHLEGFKKIEGVASAKGELLDALGTDDLAVLNLDDEWSMKIRVRTSARVVTFGLGEKADVRASAVQADLEGIRFEGPERTVFHVPVLGRHNVHNALAAVAVARRLGMDMKEIADGLATFRTPEMRLEVVDVDGITVLNDCYNANPVSVRSALDVFATIRPQGRTHVVLGDMRELGSDSQRLHEELGRELGGRGMDHLWLVGPEMRHAAKVARASVGLLTKVHYAKTLEELDDQLTDSIESGDAVLVKGSRAMGMERVLDLIRASRIQDATDVK